VAAVQAPAVIAFQYINLFYYKYHEYVILPVLFQIAFDAVWRATTSPEAVIVKRVIVHTAWLVKAPATAYPL
jgi:hypothetical protein